MTEDLVARIMIDHTVLMDYLRANREISFLSTMESSLPKVVLLAAASDLEHEIQQIIINYYEQQTNNCEFAINFVHNKAVMRQYHSYFDWKGRSANGFLPYSVKGLRLKLAKALKVDTEMAQAVADFCEIGDLRNQLVHENYAAFTVEKTAREVHDMYMSAKKFVAGLPTLLLDN